MRIYLISFFIYFSFLFTFQLTAQCDIIAYTDSNATANSDTIFLCEGDSAILYSDGGCPTYLQSNDFDNGTLGSGWTSNANPMFNNPCGPGPNGTIYAWIGDQTNFPRELVTQAYNVTTQCQICFDMRYAVQGQASPCEGPDLTDEGVHLQYSTDGGITWIDINYWDPNGGYDPYMTSWNNYCENIPVNGTVNFRWFQDVTSGNDYDHWGLDNVEIFCPPPTQTVIWNDGTNDIYFDFGPFSVSPTTTTAYVVTVSDGTNSEDDTVIVEVLPSPNLSISGLDSTYCINASSATLTGNPPGGTFTGNGITGNVFDPSTAGIGYDTISYHYYNISTYLSTGDHILFEDDFANDLGWTGYGSGGWTRGSATASSGCSGAQDPSTDHTPTADNYIIGNYLGACYPNNMSQTYWLTSPTVDCSGMTNCRIEFYSHSGCESSSYDHIYIDAFNGTTWVNIFSNGGSSSESTWTQRVYDVSAEADNNPNFRIRFGMGSTDGSVTYCGWNIDDFKVIGQGDIWVSDTLCDFETQAITNVITTPTSTFTFVDSICYNTETTVTYTGNATSSGTYTWNFDGGIITSGSGQGPYTVYWTTGGSYNISLTVTEGGCTSTLTTQTITVLPAGHPNCCIMPTPNAGVDDSICSHDYTLNATASTTNGTWSFLNGPGTATFTDANNPNSNVNVSADGTYSFIWTEDNGPSCITSDTVVIQFANQPIANAGSNDQICSHSYTLNGVASYGNGSWSYSGPGTATFSNPNDPTSDISVDTDGSYIFTWTEDNGLGCVDANSVTIDFAEMPIANAGQNDSVCDLHTTIAAIPSVGTGTWSVINGSGNVSFTDNHSATTQVTVSNPGAYIFVWTENNGLGCTDSDTVTVHFSFIPTADFTIDSIACFGDPTTVVYTGTALSSANYIWNFNGANVTPGTGQGPQTVTFSSSGTYTISLQVEQWGCNSEVVTHTVYNPEEITTSIVHINESCYHSYDGSIDLTVTGGTYPYSFQWNTGATSEDLSGITANTYSVMITDANGCHAVNSVEISSPSPIIVSVPASVNLCLYQDITINASATGGTSPYTYQWNTGSSTQSITVAPTEDIIYSVQVTDANGCSSNTAYTQVYVSSQVNLSAFSMNDTVCPGESTQIIPVVSSGMPPYLFLIDGNIVSQPIFVYPEQNTIYQLTVQDACNTTATVEIPINVYPVPVISFSTDVQEGCQPLTVHFNDQMPDSGQTNIWMFGDMASFGTGSNPTHIYESDGTFDVTLTVSSLNGCTNSMTVPNYISVYPKPEARFSPKPKIASILNPEIYFLNRSNNFQESLWSFGDGDSSLLENPVHRYLNLGEYSVILIVESDKGCLDTAETIITISDQYTFYAPSAFSPDNDGINDYFYVSGRGIDTTNFLMVIYDRWGEEIFSTNKITDKWDGKAKDNKDVPVGVYVWHVIYQDLTGKKNQKTGYITLIR